MSQDDTPKRPLTGMSRRQKDLDNERKNFQEAISEGFEPHFEKVSESLQEQIQILQEGLEVQGKQLEGQEGQLTAIIAIISLFK